jgi:hypothetical protein
VGVIIGQVGCRIKGWRWPFPSRSSAVPDGYQAALAVRQKPGIEPQSPRPNFVVRLDPAIGPLTIALPLSQNVSVHWGASSRIYTVLRPGFFEAQKLSQSLNL